MTDGESRSIAELIDAVPWGRLAFAYDFASDAPAMLRSQVGSSELDAAFDDWMFSSVVHQGTPYSATAPTLWIMRRIVEAEDRHPALEACLGAVSECAAALSWVESSADTETARRALDQPTQYRNPAGDPPWASFMPPGYTGPPRADGKVHDDYFLASTADIEALRTCVADWHSTIVRCLSERHAIDAAIDAASAVVSLWPSEPAADELASLVLDQRVALHHRASAVFALSRCGRDVTALVDPDNRALRFALALGDPDRAGHLDVLVEALGDLPWIAATFTNGLPGTEPWLVANLIAVVLERTTFADASASLAEALENVLAGPSGPLAATYEWGPVLAWAFPERVQQGVVRSVPLPESLTAVQCRFLHALLGNHEAWGSEVGQLQSRPETRRPSPRPGRRGTSRKEGPTEFVAPQDTTPLT